MTEYNTTSPTALSRDKTHNLANRHSNKISEQVVAAVTEAANCSDHELIPLYEVIDPEALNRLFAPTYEGNGRKCGRINFEYAGFEVDITSEDGVTLTPISSANEQ